MAHGMFGGDDCYEKPPGKLTEREDGMTNCDCDENDMYCPHGKLTDNSQSKYAAERSAYADRGLEPDDDKLTPNISTEPPILTNSSDDQSPSCDPFIGQAGVYHPTSAWNSMDNRIEPNQQSVYGADVAAQQMEQAGLTLRDFDGIPFEDSIYGEKDPPPSTPDVHIKDFNTPQERVVPPPDKNSENYIDIVFDGPPGPVSGRFIEVEDSDGRSISIGTWVEYGECNPSFWALRILDPRQIEPLRAELAKYRGMQDETLAVTRKTSAQLQVVTELLNQWKVDFIEALSTLKNGRDTVVADANRYKSQYIEQHDENVMLKAQNDELTAGDINHKRVNALNQQRITELRATNQQILTSRRIANEEIKELKRQLHAARSEAAPERQNPRSLDGTNDGHPKPLKDEIVRDADAGTPRSRYDD